MCHVFLWIGVLRCCDDKIQLFTNVYLKYTCVRNISMRIWRRVMKFKQEHYSAKLPTYPYSQLVSISCVVLRWSGVNEATLFLQIRNSVLSLNSMRVTKNLGIQELVCQKAETIVKNPIAVIITRTRWFKSNRSVNVPLSKYELRTTTSKSKTPIPFRTVFVAAS